MFRTILDRLTERRASDPDTPAQSYTDLLVGQLEALATGANADAAATAALETGAHIIGSCLGAATVAPDDPVRLSGLDSDTLQQIGRDLVRRGESVWLIDMDGAALRLTPVSDYYCYGARDYRYKAGVNWPSNSEWIDASRDEILHVKWARDPRQPWKGQSPMTLAATTFRATGKLEASIGDEAGIPAAQLIAMPDQTDLVQRRQEFLDSGGDAMSRDMRNPERLSAAATKGHVVVVPSIPIGPGGDTWISKGHSPLPSPGTPGSYKPYRIGGEFGPAHDPLRRSLFASVLALLGVPVSMAGLDAATGQESRESFRRFQLTTLAAIRKRVQLEARRKLRVPELEIDMSALQAPDAIVSRARAFGSMASNGLPVDEAAQISGIRPQ